MDRFARLSVDYCQYQVHSLPGRRGLEVYTIGDDLLHVGGPTEFTGFAGTHTGWIEMRVVTAAAVPPTRPHTENRPLGQKQAPGYLSPGAA